MRLPSQLISNHQMIDLEPRPVTRDEKTAE